MTTIKRGAARLDGVGKLAEELGVSRFHLGAVLHGRRSPSEELAAALEARNIKYRRLRRRAERWV